MATHQSRTARFQEAALLEAPDTTVHLRLLNPCGAHETRSEK